MDGSPNRGDESEMLTRPPAVVPRVLTRVQCRSSTVLGIFATLPLPVPPPLQPQIATWVTRLSTLLWWRLLLYLVS
jgi:hypothetical protein